MFENLNDIFKKIEYEESGKIGRLMFKNERLYIKGKWKNPSIYKADIDKMNETSFDLMPDKTPLFILQNGTSDFKDNEWIELDKLENNKQYKIVTKAVIKALVVKKLKDFNQKQKLSQLRIAIDQDNVNYLAYLVLKHNSFNAVYDFISNKHILNFELSDHDLFKEIFYDRLDVKILGRSGEAFKKANQDHWLVTSDFWIFYKQMQALNKYFSWVPVTAWPANKLKAPYVSSRWIMQQVKQELYNEDIFSSELNLELSFNYFVLNLKKCSTKKINNTIARTSIPPRLFDFFPDHEGTTDKDELFRQGIDITRNRRGAYRWQEVKAEQVQAKAEKEIQEIYRNKNYELALILPNR